MGKHDGWGFADGGFGRNEYEQSDSDKEAIVRGLRAMERLGRHATHVLKEIKEKGFYEGTVITANRAWGANTDWKTPDLHRKMLMRMDGVLRGDMPDPTQIVLKFEDTKMRKAEMEVRLEGPVAVITGPSTHEVRMKSDVYFGSIRFNKTGTVIDIGSIIKVRKMKIPMGEEKEAFVKKICRGLVENEARVTVDSPYVILLRQNYARVIEETGTFERLWKYIMEMEPILSVEKS